MSAKEKNADYLYGHHSPSMKPSKTTTGYLKEDMLTDLFMLLGYIFNGFRKRCMTASFYPCWLFSKSSTWRLHAYILTARPSPGKLFQTWSYPPFFPALLLCCLFSHKWKTKQLYYLHCVSSGSLLGTSHVPYLSLFCQPGPFPNIWQVLYKCKNEYPDAASAFVKLGIPC